MLERIREGAQGPWAMIIIGLIVLSFVFAGVGSYLTAPTSTAVAKVNGEEISSEQLERAYQNQRAQMESQFGEGLSALFADANYLAQFRRQALDQLIGDLLLKQHAESLGLRVSDEQVKETIVSIPQFQVGGEFNNDRYLVAIRQSGYQASEFREYIRREMTRDQLSRALGASGFALPDAAKFIAELEQQTRDANIVTLDAKSFADEVDVSQEDINIYYDANLASFDTEEKVNIAYVELNAADLEKDVVVSDDEVSQYYQDNIASYQKEGTRSVSHILVEYGDDKDAALAKIKTLSERLKGGESFETLAKSESNDTFSAENGGDLGEISEGVMGDEFDAAAFGLAKVGDVSDIVETDFGYHLIKVTQITPTQTQPFEDVKQEILQTLQKDKALDKFYELQTEMTQLAFEVPESLDEVAEAIDGKVQTTGLLSRSFAPSPFDRADVLAVAFSEDLVQDHLNSDIVEIDDNHVIVMRAAHYEPQRTRSIDEVSDQIKTILTVQSAQEAARTWAQLLVDTYQSDPNAAQAMLTEKGIDWTKRAAISRNSADLAPDVRSALFALSPNSTNNMDVVNLGSDSVAVVQLTQVNKLDAVSEETVAQYRQRLASATTNRDVAALIEALKADADIVITQQP